MLLCLVVVVPCVLLIWLGWCVLLCLVVFRVALFARFVVFACGVMLWCLVCLFGGVCFVVFDAGDVVDSCVFRFVRCAC